MEIVEEKFNWTNLESFKVAFSDDVKNAVAFTKSANKLYNEGNIKQAKENYKEALQLWNKCIREVRSIPETSNDYWSLSNWVAWVPIFNYVYIIISVVANTKITSAAPGDTRVRTTALQKKLDVAMNGSKSYSKRLVMDSLIFIQDFVEERLKDCEAGKAAYSFESWMFVAMNGSLDAISECMNNLNDDTNVAYSDTTYHAMESYIQSYV